MCICVFVRRSRCRQTDSPLRSVHLRLLSICTPVSPRPALSAGRTADAFRVVVVAGGCHGQTHHILQTSKPQNITNRRKEQNGPSTSRNEATELSWLMTSRDENPGGTKHCFQPVHYVHIPFRFDDVPTHHSVLYRLCRLDTLVGFENEIITRVLVFLCMKIFRLARSHRSTSHTDRARATDGRLPTDHDGARVVNTTTTNDNNDNDRKCGRDITDKGRNNNDRKKNTNEGSHE